MVTEWYWAPKLPLSPIDYSATIDVWSISCIFMELINCARSFG